MLTDNKTKKCLAPRRDFRPSNIHVRKGIETPENQLQNDKNLNLNIIAKKSDPKQKPQCLAYEQKYRNKNITTVPTSLLNIFSGMNVLDISYNSLNDSQIELVMSSCQKLVTLCIQGNFNTLIPVSISKMKQLRIFKHDWVNICMGTEDYQEPEERLQLIKSYVKKPQHIVKSNKISGMSFQIYSIEVSKTTLDFILYKKIQHNCRCSEPAKQAMYKCIKSFQQKTKNKKWLKNLVESEELVPCRVVCGLNERHNHQSKKPSSVLITKQPEEETESGSKNIIIEDIRQITETEVLSTKPVRYSCPGMPLHEIFGNYDSKLTSNSQVDGILLRGYNPNQYDSQGLTPYHICVIHNQIKGIEYLLQISSKNLGFFDLQMPSQKQCRNILHYSVFLKNYLFTKKLIQFGFPIDKRDSSGARMIHLVDQNYQFLLLLRKLLKKKTFRCRSQSILGICGDKKYSKHPERIKDEGKIKTFSFSSQTLKAYQQLVSINKHSLKKKKEGGD